jgi:hypothetical protein
MGIKGLKDTLDHVALKAWEKEIESHMKTRQCWHGILETMLAGGAPVLTPRQEQNLELLKQGPHKSLHKAILDRLSPKIDTNEVEDSCVQWDHQVGAASI